MVSNKKRKYLISKGIILSPWITANTEKKIKDNNIELSDATYLEPNLLEANENSKYQIQEKLSQQAHDSFENKYRKEIADNPEKYIKKL